MIPLLTTASTVMCPHGGQARLATGNTQALADGAAVLLQTDVHVITGCPFVAAAAPSPCVSIRWVTAAARTKVNGVPVLLQSSVGLCANALQVPQGTALVARTQQAVKGI